MVDLHEITKDDIDQLYLSGGISKKLKSVGIFSISDLASQDRYNLEQINGISKKSIDEIISTFAQFGIELGDQKKRPIFQKTCSLLMW